MKSLFNESQEQFLFDEDPEYLDFKKNIKILIVDELKEDCLIIESYLRCLGHENIRSASNGFQGVRLIEEECPDIVLMEIEMPGFNGPEMLLRLRKKIINQELTVLMISAYGSMENIVLCIKMGAIDFLSKPFNQDLLRSRIEACLQKKWFIYKNNRYREQLKNERNKYENLLHAVFPAAIVEELAQTNKVAPKIYENVAVLFTDIVGFTSYCEEHSLEEISSTIRSYAEICEKAALRNNLQKLKTIGDGFMAVGGMIFESQNPVEDCLNCALQIIEEYAGRGKGCAVRAGIEIGPVIGGIVGHRQYLFDIWGDTVNTCARILSETEPNCVCLTSSAWSKCSDRYHGQSLGFGAVKGKSREIELFQVSIDNNYN